MSALLLYFIFYFICIIESHYHGTDTTISRREQSCLDIKVVVSFGDGVQRINVSSNLGNPYTVKTSRETIYYVEECLSPDGCYLLEMRGSFSYNVTVDGRNYTDGILYDDGTLLYIGSKCPVSFCGPFKDELWVLSYKDTGNVQYTWDYGDEQFSGTLTAGYNTIFCVEQPDCYIIEGIGLGYYYHLDQGYIVDQGELTYASDCIGKCIAHPLLAGTNRGQDISLIVSTISGMSTLTDVNTPQYKAACWIIHDDLARLDPQDPNLLQRYIVTVLFYATNGTQWFFSEELGFLSPKSECDWNLRVSGIRCSDNNITEISLNYNNLTGEIPNELYWLNHLETLELYYNNLTGVVSPAISLLISLKTLNLSYNGLYGVLPNLVKLTKLHSLIINNNFFEGSLSLPYDIDSVNAAKNRLNSLVNINFENASSLRVFYADFNSFIGTIPTSIAGLKNLEMLSLRSNKLNGTIPSQILTLPLTNLNLFDNKLVGSIPNEITYESKLKSLILSRNRLYGSIPPQLSNATQLAYLLLSNNHLNGTFPSELGSLKELVLLEIEDNRISGTIPSFDKCSRSFKVDCTVTCDCCSSCFGLFTNYIENAYPPPSNLTLRLKTTYPESFSVGFIVILNNANQTIVEEFNIQTFNEYSRSVFISMTDCYRIFVSRAQSSTNRSLLNQIYIDDLLLTSEYGDSEGNFSQNIGYSALSPTGSLSQPIQKAKCDYYNICDRTLAPNDPIRQLVNIVTRFTRIEDIVEDRKEAMCWWIQDLENVEDLDDTKVQRYLLALFYFTTDGENWANNDKWLGNESACFWHGITCEAGVITGINLDSNNIKGTIPSELGQLEDLQDLQLSGNNLFGSFPIGLANLENLRTMNLSNNEFVGSIQSNIKHLESLKILDISYNLFSSNIPPAIGEMESLQFLKASSNSFTSELPSEIYKLTNLTYLSLADNFLGGNVIELVELSKLVHLNLSVNYFTGPLPIFFGHTNMQVLDVSQNSFDGVIPISIGNMSSLRELYIYDNSIVGSIPSAIGDAGELSRVSVSYNSLKGTVPSEINKLKKLLLLHLHNNDLTGTVPRADINDFISDCGNASITPAKVICISCSICCNQEGACLNKKITWPPLNGISTEPIGVKYTFTITVITFFLVFLICLILSCCNITKPKLPFKARDQFQIGSIYRFFLSSSLLGHLLGFLSITMHTVILFSFLQAADFTYSNNEWIYSTSCPNNDLNCTNNLQTNTQGWVIFGFILTSFLLPDFLDSVLLLWESVISSDIKGLYAATMVFYITTISVTCSVIYNYATGISNTVIYLNSGILLFLNSIDDQFFLILIKIKPSWIKILEEEISSGINHHSQGSIISDRLHDTSSRRALQPRSIPSQIEDSSSMGSSSSYHLDKDKLTDKLKAEVRDLKRKQKTSMEKINNLENSKSFLEKEYAQLRKDYAEMKQMIEKMNSS